MMENVNGLSLNLLIHPGETLKEILEDRHMSQEELAIRTGYSPKHISEVVRGKKDISFEFANRLEYALDIPSHFWMNLQGIYDRDSFEINNINNIQKEELNILKDLKEVINYCEKKDIIKSNSKKELTVMNLRKFLNVNNLCDIPNLPIQQISFRGSKKSKVNIYVLYAWQKICEYNSNKKILTNSYNCDNLLDQLINIKKTMFLPFDKMIVKLKNIFESCGIIFDVVQNFKGAPVQGFIKKRDDKVILCLTLKNTYSDIFWFTLFHELGHLLYEDFSDKYIDYQFDNNINEEKADQFAKEILINTEDYNNFINKNDLSLKSIELFSKEHDIIPSILIGRIQNDTQDYSFLANKKTKYSLKN